MSVRDDLNALCHVEAQMAALKAQQEELRSRLRQHALEVFDRDGAAPTWRADLGTISLTIPKPKVSVLDDGLVAEFVAERYGVGAVETVRRARPEFFDALVKSSAVGDGFLVSDDGEPVPGVAVTPRPAYLTVRLSKEAKAAAAGEVDAA